MNMIRNMNNYLSDGKNFADVIQGIVLFLVLFIGAAQTSGNGQYVIPLLDLLISIPLICCFKILIYDSLLKNKELPYLDFIPFATVMILMIMMSMIYPVIATVGNKAESEIPASSYNLDYIELLGIYALSYLVSVHIIRTAPFFRYNQPCPHCDHLNESPKPKQEPKKVEAAKPSPAPKVEQPKPIEVPPSKPSNNLPDIFKTSKALDVTHGDLE